MKASKKFTLIITGNKRKLNISVKRGTQSFFESFNNKKSLLWLQSLADILRIQENLSQKTCEHKFFNVSFDETGRAISLEVAIKGKWKLVAEKWEECLKIAQICRGYLTKK